MASDLVIAIDKTARNYKEESGERGFRAMATRMGQDPNYFSNKFSASYDGAHPTPDELIAAMDLAEDYEILSTMARSCRRKHVVIELGEYSEVSDVELLDAHLHLQTEIGETSAVIREALSKGQISKAAFSEIDREMSEDVRAIYELRARLQGLIR
jgi:regulatory protein CII